MTIHTMFKVLKGVGDFKCKINNVSFDYSFWSNVIKYPLSSKFIYLKKMYFRVALQKTITAS